MSVGATNERFRVTRTKWLLPTLINVTAPDPRAVLLIDGECGLCTSVAKLGQRLGVHCSVVALQSVDLADMGVDAMRTTTEVALRLPDGTTLYGHEAVAGALQRGGRVLRLVGGAMGWGPVIPVTRWTYRAVSRRRRRLRAQLPSPP